VDQAVQWLIIIVVLSILAALRPGAPTRISIRESLDTNSALDIGKLPVIL